MKFVLASFVFILSVASAAAAQAPKPVKALPPSVTSSPAYAELLLRRTEIESGLEALVLEYTEEYPKVQENRQSLVLIRAEAERLSKVTPAESGKLTLALGKLIIRKIELELDLWNLLKSYKEEHPDVKRARKKVDIYEAAIKEILG